MNRRRELQVIVLSLRENMQKAAAVLEQVNTGQRERTFPRSLERAFRALGVKHQYVQTDLATAGSALEAGTIRAFITLAGNPILSSPNAGRLAAALGTRVTPEIRFEYDASVEGVVRVSKILSDLARERGEEEVEEPPSEPGGEEE